MRARMTTGVTRDEHELVSGLTAWLQRADAERGELRVSLRHATVGWSNETLLVEAAWPDDTERLVVRLPPLVPSYPTYDLDTQQLVQNSRRDSGFPVPRVITVEHDPEWLGAPFLVMEHVDGTVAGEVPGLDPWITDAPLAVQEQVQHAFVDALADMHRLAVDEAVAGALRRGVAAEIDFWSEYIAWAADGSPASSLTAALEWCRNTVPALEPEPVVLWGDARLGNVMFDADRRVVAVLDWELASLGPPEMDVAWFVALDELTAKATGARAPGFEDRGAVLARYEQRLGRQLVDLRWHEIFALVRSIAINDKLARLVTAAGGNAPGGFGDDNLMLPYVTRRIERFEAAGRSG
jgi:aminoglycoside phosphotransferase (APT) family kinase protein